MPGDARGYKGTSKNEPVSANFTMTNQSCQKLCGKTRGSFPVVACRLHYKTGSGPETLRYAWFLGVHLRPTVRLRRT